jgi:Sulfatase-modifying factor enzyme 1
VLAPARPWWRPAVWGTIAAVLVIGVAVGLAANYFRNPPSPTTGPERANVWSPPGWTIPDAAETKTLASGLVVPTRLTRQVGDEQLELLLILSAAPGDPPAFYMLRNKITNRVFRTVWEGATANPASRLSQFLNRHDPLTRKELAPRKWEEGALANDGLPLGSQGDQDGVPVVGVTAPEAMLVAAELGGQLPTSKQWRKAVGANAEDTRLSPAGVTKIPDDNLAKRSLALGLKNGPWPVADKTLDVSVHEIHQLTSNGFEWAEKEDESQRIALFAGAAQVQKLPVTGQSWEFAIVLTFSGMAEPIKKTLDWTDTSQLIGFRIVITPQ